MKSKSTNMTAGNPAKLILLFALPLMLGNIFQNFYIITDTVIVGRGVGINALAALGAVDWLSWLLISVASGLTQGFAILISQKFGEGDLDAVRRITGLSFRLTLIFSVVFTVLGCAMIPGTMKWLNVKTDLRPMAMTYISFLYGGFFFSFMYNYGASMLRAVGNSRTPLVAMIISSIVNIVLDLVTVFVFKWGIAGAAGSTIFAQGVAGAFCFIRLRKTPELLFTKEDMKRDLPLTKTLLVLGLPLSAMNLVICAGGVIVQSVVNKCSISFIAGYTAPNKMYGIMEIAAVSYGFAVTTYIGQNYGADRPDRIRSGMRSALLLAGVTAAAIGALLVLFGRYLVMMFISADDPAVVDAAVNTGYSLLRIMAICLPILYFLYVFRSALQGIGKTLPTMISGIIEFGCRVSLAIIVSVLAMEDRILFAEVIAWVGAATFLGSAWYYYQFRMFRRSS